MTHVLTALAWPYANGPRHIGHVAGFGVPADVFARYMRMRGHDVLMVSGTDEHGTPILVQADSEGLTAAEAAAKYNRIIVEDLDALGLSYDLFTRTTTGNHYKTVQELFSTLYGNGYILQKKTLGAISPSTGRTLPDRYIEGTCPHCGFDSARGDQCDNCGRQLDPTDLIDPKSRINGETPKFVEEDHFFLDLPAFADALNAWLDTRTGWRTNVLRFTKNLLDEMHPRPISRDLDWGVPIPLEGWIDRPDKRLYVWFDAVIGYLSATIEWARRSGDPDAWKRWWQDPEAVSYYFMGKDNIVFHSEIWPAMLLGANGEGANGGEPGPLGKLNLPTEVVSSEFLTMEGKQFSSSRRVVIYVRDFLERYSPDALRYYICAAGPENQDSDFTWAEFLRRNNDELVAGWGNLVNRSIAMAAKNFGAVPEPGELEEVDRELLATTKAAFDTVGDLIGANKVRAGIGEAMKAVAAANKYLADTAPWKMKEDPKRQGTVLYTVLQAVSDLKTVMSPFLPHSSQRVHELLGGEGVFAPMPFIEEVADLDEGQGATDGPYPILTGDYSDVPKWESVPLVPGTVLEKPTPVFTKLEPSIVDEEIERLNA
ncbi:MULTISPECIES: methionine--tRNA ligase [Glycomyces]|uniref:Methionine--tRNA ligase n=1 Tax=Glycomyces lechevalierae TaxID=256034 RepID=A0A9X3PHA0_9ACTN|nr:methionine--tRNA ligase [Glycomyces lechevalierae]MDA1385449.1 methionine--tRNA ligase [Glycomyces lechevalierae]MDR7339714.1 methionyl-tRNA synthetase [Glycomyces lechevalierae]